MKKGLLLSGGMDSTAVAHLYKPDVAFNIDYGQNPARAERNAARAVCDELGIELIEIDVDCSSIGSGDLSRKNALDVAAESDWWPFRNQLLITIASAKALEFNCNELMIGTIANDSYHSDGSAEFIDLINKLISFQEGSLKITAPVIEINGIELLRSAELTYEQLSLAHSCHKSYIPCGNCRGCFKYVNSMNELGFYNEK